MSYIAASGFCLAALVGSVIYETKRLRKEEQKLRESLRKLSSSV